MLRRHNLIIMDNSGTHRNIIVKEDVSATNNRLQYSVLYKTILLRYPYRSKTNAIETWFSRNDLSV